MRRKAKSARGEIVDFDLLDIKSQIASAPKSVEVKKREDFIDRKLRRRIKKIKKKIETTDVDPSIIEDNTDKQTEKK